MGAGRLGGESCASRGWTATRGHRSVRRPFRARATGLMTRAEPRPRRRPPSRARGVAVRRSPLRPRTSSATGARRRAGRRLDLIADPPSDPYAGLAILSCSCARSALVALGVAISSWSGGFGRYPRGRRLERHLPRVRPPAGLPHAPAPPRAPEGRRVARSSRRAQWPARPRRKRSSKRSRQKRSSNRSRRRGRRGPRSPAAERAGPPSWPSVLQGRDRRRPQPGGAAAAARRPGGSRDDP